MAQQIEDIEGGLTELEKRAYRYLCEQAGCNKIYLVTSSKPLTITEAIKELNLNEKQYKIV